MSIVQEIIDETKRQTRIKLKKNSKRILFSLGIISVTMSTIFYILGVPYQDSTYRQFPIFVGVPVLAMASFNAFGMTTIALFFVGSLGEVTHSTIKHNLEQRKEAKIKTNSKAIYDTFNEFGHKDYSIQIDEAKAGLQSQIDENMQEVAILKAENTELKAKVIEYQRLVLPHIARQNRSNFDFNHRLKRVEEKQNEKTQIINDKAQSRNNSENTDLKKFKEDL